MADTDESSKSSPVWAFLSRAAALGRTRHGDATAGGMLQLPSGTSTRTSPAGAQRVAVPPGRTPLGKAEGFGAPCPGGSHEDEPSSFTPTPNPSAASPWLRRCDQTCSPPGPVFPWDKESPSQNGAKTGSPVVPQAVAAHGKAKARLRSAQRPSDTRGWHRPEPETAGSGGTNRCGHTELHPIKCFSLGMQAAKGEKKRRGANASSSPA